MIYVMIAFVIGIVITLFFIHKPLIRLVAEKKAIPKIEKILFKNKEHNKSNVLDIIHQLTNSRLSDEMVMDYFYKIKGIQVLNHKPINFWMKIYLATPTKIKLNYFEQVKFYETFLNFPRIDGVHTEDAEMKVNGIKTSVKKQFPKNFISQKLA